MTSYRLPRTGVTIPGKRPARPRRSLMLPDCVTYHASWVDSTGTKCFQLMEAPDQDALKSWASLWEDLIEFEIIEVLPSRNFWSKAHSADKSQQLRAAARVYVIV